MTQLKPCPFCGSKNLRQHSQFPVQVWSVKCRDCGGKMTCAGSQEQVISAWNRRVCDE